MFDSRWQDVFDQTVRICGISAASADNRVSHRKFALIETENL